MLTDEKKEGKEKDEATVHYLNVYLGKDNEPLSKAWKALVLGRPSAKSESDLARGIILDYLKSLEPEPLINEDGSLNEKIVKGIMRKKKDII